MKRFILNTFVTFLLMLNGLLLILLLIVIPYIILKTSEAIPLNNLMNAIVETTINLLLPTFVGSLTCTCFNKITENDLYK